MKISIGHFFKNKYDFDNANIICPIEFFNRDKYLNLRLLVRIMFILFYGFGFGYSIYFNVSSVSELKIYLLSFAILYFLIFYLIQIPHEFIHSLFYKNPFKNKVNKLIFFNKNRLLTSELTEEINSFMLFLSLITPFLIFSLIPLIIISVIGFNLNLYALSFANAILSSEDLLNIILELISDTNNGCKSLFIIPNNYDYLLENTSSDIMEVTTDVNNTDINDVSNNEITLDNLIDTDFDIDQLELFDNSNNFNNIEDTLEFKSDDSPKDLKNDDFTNVVSELPIDNTINSDIK